MQEVSPSMTFKRMETAQIVDVREDEEVSAGMIPGALHIPLGQLQTRLPELDSARPTITVCRSGRRSLTAAQTLSDAGFTVESMEGGMNLWAKEGHPTALP
ncbi:rhodanese-like domain-containing protein [Nesterenkonia sp. YGD6]|uniref:rhodanese-like domain-containing protein n=2 Tax=Nesterenkonia sp. YGD6 TaxID=2901231 RepID=UPI001F4D3519|nr:rhodanese-like domain-containing protein [Nesterenkonia sp. YGD6]MCH8561869.1 rhodanese-like domain-containing protein [Nesterenkonia sp. YGD6]